MKGAKMPKANKVAKKAAKLLKLANALKALADKNGKVGHSKLGSKIGAEIYGLASELAQDGLKLQLHLAVSA
jgi:hypothetical protein